MKLSPEKVNSIVAKTAEEKLYPRFNSYLISFQEVYSLLDQSETELIKQLLTIKPAEYGVQYPYLGIEEVPADIVKIEGQIIKLEEDKQTLDNKYLPRQAFLAYTKLNEQHMVETGKNLLIGSGYRSPARQALNFLRWYKEFNYDLKKTLRYSAIPGYSQHSLPINTAIDFRTETGVGIPGEPPHLDFGETPEFSWLMANASKFDFYLSYPRDNELGVEYEPWHWQFISNS